MAESPKIRPLMADEDNFDIFADISSTEVVLERVPLTGLLSIPNDKRDNIC